MLGQYRLSREAFIQIISNIKDPRINRNKLYPLEEILFVAFCTILAGESGYIDMNYFGTNKLRMLKRVFPFQNGIPSEDTFERVLKLVNVGAFNKCLSEWARSIAAQLKEKRMKKNDPETTYIAVDGKTLRGSAKPSKKKSALQLVNAFANEEQLVLASTAVPENANELSAIPNTLRLLELKGAIVSLDAMGCQTKIAQQIIEQGGDFVFALKGNQGELHDDVKGLFEYGRKQKFRGFKKLERHDDPCEKGHGRIEKREYVLSADTDWLKERHPHWSMVNAIGYVQGTRTIGAKTTVEIRYYITSLKKDVKKVAKAIRKHWGIENSAHHVLDVTFGEDDCKVRDRTAAQNIATMRRMAMNLLRQDDSGLSMKRKMRKAAMDDDYLLRLLEGLAPQPK